MHPCQDLHIVGTKAYQTTLNTLRMNFWFCWSQIFITAGRASCDFSTFGLIPRCPTPEAAVVAVTGPWVRGLHWLVCCRYNLTFASQKCQLTEWHFLLERSGEWQETGFTQLPNEYSKTFWVILKYVALIPPFSLCSCEEINVTAYSYNAVKQYWKLHFPIVLVQSYSLSLCPKGVIAVYVKVLLLTLSPFLVTLFSALKSFPFYSLHLFKISSIAKSQTQIILPLVALCSAERVYLTLGAFASSCDFSWLRVSGS